MLYSEVTAICKDRGIIDNVFDYSNDDYNEDFAKFFHFGQGAFEQYKHYNIQPGIFVFNETISLNARAGFVKEHYVIDYNMGTLWFTITNFKQRPELLDLPDMERFKLVDSVSDYPINELWHQACLVYTYYHEFGHLIQKMSSLTKAEWINEENDLQNAYSQLQHVLEFDADVFSTLCSATTTVQYMDKWLDGKEIDDYENFVGLMSGVLFIYLMSFSSMNRELYFKQFTHPHPIIRISIITFVINDHVEKLLRKKNCNNMQTDKDRTLAVAFEVAEILAVELNLQFENFKIQYMQNSTEIQSYISELWGLMVELPNGAFNKWNEHAINIKK